MKKLLIFAFSIITLEAFTQSVGIGTINPTKAGLVVNAKIGNSHAIFGDNTTGVSIESSFPGIHFNSYYNSGRKAIVTGYTSGAEMNPTTGAFTIYTSPFSTTIGNTAAVFERLYINKDGDVGVGTTNPLDRFHVNGIIRSNGVKLIGNNAIETGVGIVDKEINAGKIGYGLFTPNTLDIVGGGLDINRKIRFWAEGGSKFEGPINVANISSVTGAATDNINVSANITHTEFTKLGATSLPIKTATFTVDLVKQTGTFGNSWATASLPIIPIDMRKIVSHTAIVTYNSGFVRSISQNGSAFSQTGKFKYDLTENSGQTNFYAIFDNCDLCPYPAKAIIHITYTDTNIF